MIHGLFRHHNKGVVGGIFLLGGTALIICRVLWIGIALILFGNQFAVCDAITSFVRKVHRPSRALWNDGYEMGRLDGFKEGRRTARPVVVKIDQEQSRTAKTGFLRS